jgi:four helix bundle protein
MDELEMYEDQAGNASDWAVICNSVVQADHAEHSSGSSLAEPQAVYSGSPLYRDNMLLKETFALSVKAIKHADHVKSSRLWLMSQFERSSCSPGANAKEAQNAESLKDFIHKLKIASKEADESEYWYFVIAATHDNANDPAVIEQIQRVMRILNKIIATCKEKLKKKND